MVHSVRIPNKTRQLQAADWGEKECAKTEQRPRQHLSGYHSLKEKFAAAPQMRSRKPAVSEPLSCSIGFDVLGTAVKSASVLVSSPSFKARRCMMEDLAAVDDVQASRLARLREELEASAQGKLPCSSRRLRLCCPHAMRHDVQGLHFCR